MASLVYERRRPETTLYHVVQENLDTLYGAYAQGFLDTTWQAAPELDGVLARRLDA